MPTLLFLSLLTTLLLYFLNYKCPKCKKIKPFAYWLKKGWRSLCSECERKSRRKSKQVDIF
jgi:thiol-disulfide isomerase/thioredoxin